MALALAAPLNASAQRQQAPAPIEGTRPAPVAPVVAPAAPAATRAMANDETAILDAINMLRAAESLGPLISHAGLNDAARRHSAEMAQAHTLAHVSPTTGSPADRASAAGVRASRVTQNISRRPTGMAAHEAILASEAHRAQLLDPNATHIGVGLASGEDGIYLTELMARLVPEPALPPPSVADVPQPPEPTPALVDPEPAQPDPYYPAEPPPQVTTVPQPPQAQPQQAYTQAQPQPPAQGTGTLPTLRLTRAHRGVAGYWLFHEGRWWYFPVPAGTRTGQLIYPDTSVTGSPPGYQGTPATTSTVPTRVQPTPTTAPRGYWRLTPQ